MPRHKRWHRDVGMRYVSPPLVKPTRSGIAPEGTGDELSAIEKPGELASEDRPGISANRSRPRLNGECEREAAHRIERDAESPGPLGARNVLRCRVGGDRGEHGGLGPLERGKRGVELGIVGGSDPHLDPYGVQ